MSSLASVRGLSRSQVLATLAYAALILALLVAAAAATFDLRARYGARQDAAELLARLEQRARPPVSNPGPAAAVPPGSPFLDGQTVTIAGAALVQRMTSAINRAGGRVVSSEVEREAKDKDGYVKVAVTCELDPVALQQVLYALEAGMPFLTVDELTAQAPPTEAEGGRLRVHVAASGLWRGGK